MKTLRTILYVEAMTLLAWAVATGLFPAWVTETLGDQAPLAEYAWVRLTAVQAFGFAMMMWLTAVEIERRWWYSWAFVITAAGIALVSAWAAVANLFDARSPRLWWFLAVAAALHAAALIVGLARAGLERQPE